MVGKKKPNQLGRALIKNRFSNTNKKKVEDNMVSLRSFSFIYQLQCIVFFLASCCRFERRLRLGSTKPGVGDRGRFFPSLSQNRRARRNGIRG